jgi:hypothetical protein
LNLFHTDSLGDTENLETADYLKEGDVGFKKPKVGIYFNLIVFISLCWIPLDKEEKTIPTSCCRG